MIAFPLSWRARVLFRRLQVEVSVARDNCPNANTLTISSCELTISEILNTSSELRTLKYPLLRRGIPISRYMLLSREFVSDVRYKGSECKPKARSKKKFLRISTVLAFMGIVPSRCAISDVPNSTNSMHKLHGPSLSTSKRLPWFLSATFEIFGS